MMSKIWCLSVAILWGLSVQGQKNEWMIRGTVLEGKTRVPVPGANVLLMVQRVGLERVALTNTGADGTYQIRHAGLLPSEMRVTAMGFAGMTVRLDTVQRSGIVVLDVLLERQDQVLDEVIIDSHNTQLYRRDTLVFDAAALALGGEQVIQDLLKNIPGVQIAADGTIRVGHLAIEKIMVEGDDFFGKGYTVLSRNMPVYPIDKIEVLRNHPDDDMLRGIRYSDAIALNLTLKDDYTRRWFGNVEGGLAPFAAKKHELKSDVMNFAKTDKYYFLQNANSIGYEPLLAAPELIRSPLDKAGDIPQAIHFVGLKEGEDGTVPLHRRRSNQARMGSLNTIIRPSEQWKLRFIALWDSDNNRISKHTEEILLLPDDRSIERSGYFVRRDRYQLGRGSVDLRYDISNNKVLKSRTWYESHAGIEKADLQDAGQRVGERVRSDDYGIGQTISFQHRLNGGRAVEFDWGVGIEHAVQRYHASRDPFTRRVQMDGEARTFGPDIQWSRHGFRWTTFNGTYYERRSSGNLLECYIGTSMRLDLLKTRVWPVFPEFHHDDQLYNLNIYSGIEYQYGMGPAILTGRLKLLGTENQLIYSSGDILMRSISIDPGLKIDWPMGPAEQLLVGYARMTSGHGIGDVHRQYVLRDYRTASKGSGTPGDTKFSTWTLRYQNGTLGGDYLFNTLIYLVHYPRQLSAHYQVTPTYTLSEPLIVENPYVFNLSSTFNYFIEPISSNIRMEFKASRALVKNRMNGAAVSGSTSATAGGGLELRSGFKGPFNFHFGTRLERARIVMDEVRNNQNWTGESFADLSFHVGEYLYFDLKGEWYYSYSSRGNVEAWGFLDLNLKYEVLPGRMTLFVVGRNMQNTGKGRREILGEWGLSRVTEELIPGFILMKVNLRF